MAENKKLQETAINPARAEAKELPQSLEVEYEGETYKIIPSDFTNLDVLEALEDGQYITAVRTTLGREQWKKFKDSIRDEQGRAPVEHLEKLLEKLQTTVGPTNA